MTELARESGAELLTDSAVISISKERTAVIASARHGILSCSANAVILASGCRERPVGTLPVSGTRPAGIFTAGAAQRLINLKGYDIGDTIVILGSGDVGLIMARRLTLIGKRVLAVMEREPQCTGLLRNKVQCLDDFGIPLLTSCTVTEIFGNGRITGVRYESAGGADIYGESGSAMHCDTLITSVGLIPERELIRGLEHEPWLFVCGNAYSVFDLADSAAADGEKAGRIAAAARRQDIRDKKQAETEEVTQAQLPCRALNSNEIVCGFCPKSCILQVGADALDVSEADNAPQLHHAGVTGGACNRGVEYAEAELYSPRRLITATVAVAGDTSQRLPVKSAVPVEINRMPGIVCELQKQSVTPPLTVGQTALTDVGGSGVDFLATADI
jgi:CxxC motif-containing protein